MDLEKKLNELSEYDITFEIRNGYYHMAVKYTDGWNILMPDNEYIHVEERNGIYHYIGNKDSVTIEDIFKTIDNTFEYNKDLERKLDLFKEKTNELQKLFSEENYETLKTLTFKLKKSKTKKVQPSNKEEDKNEITETEEQ